MSEYISSCQNSGEPAVAAAARIGCEALAIIDATYGTGMPRWQPGVQNLSYHNGYHGRQVGTDSYVLAMAMGVSPIARATAKAAGESHDVRLLQGRGVDEVLSADWLRDQMEAYGVFPPEYRVMGYLAVVGTEPLFDEHFKIIGQRVSELDFPSQEAELVAKSVASADFGILYRPEGPLLSHYLFREIQGMKSDAELPIVKLITFQASQVALAHTYVYPLHAANRVLATHRSEVVAYVEQTLSQLERGEILSWQQLIEQDQAFMDRHR